MAQNITARYTIVEKLGQGGMGVVYRAKDRLENEVVALKQVLVSHQQLDFASKAPDQDLDTTRLGLALEFRTLASLRHPHIVSVLDYGFDEKRQPFFTMTFLENAQPITEFAKNKSFDEQIVLIFELLEALAYLHRRGIIHRDLKPDNVMVTAEGIVKVMDFGLALSKTGSITNIHEGFAGTIAYMAPELFDDGEASVQSDLYAVGVVAYEILLGNYPYKSGTMMKTMLSIVKDTPDTSALASELAEWLDRLLEKDPDSRPETAQIVIDQLRDIVSDNDTQQSTIRESYLQAARFVGRQSEFNELLERLDEMLEGSNSFCLLGGESGVGKSRLVDELRTRALVKGTLVLRGQAVSNGGLPFQAWRSPVRRLVLDVALTEAQLSVIKNIVPDLPVLLEKDIPDVSSMASLEEENDRMMLTMMHLFRNFNKPLLVILEDIHWSNESLLPLQQLHRIADQLSNLMIVGTYRNDECPQLPEELAGYEVISLHRLNDESVEELTTAMLGEIGKQKQLLDFLKRETEGNTFFMVEVVRALIEDAGGMRNIGQGDLPETVFTTGIAEIMNRRIARIAPKYRQLLNLAALAGRQIDETLFTDIVASETELNSWLLHSQSAAVFEVQDNQWLFAHDKLREAVLSELKEQEKPTLHRQLAETIESLYPDDMNYYPQLLRHWYQAGDVDKVIHYVEPLSEYEIHSLVDIEWLEIIEILNAIRPTMSTDDESYLQISNFLSLACFEDAQFDHSQKIALEVMSFAEQHNNQLEHGKSLYHLGRIASRKKDFVNAKDYLILAITIFEEVSYRKGVVQCLDSLAMVAREQEDYEIGHQYYGQAITICETIGYKTGLAGTYNGQGILALWEKDYATALEFFEKSVQVAKEAGRLALVISALGNMGTTSAMLEDYHRAKQYIEQALDMAASINNERMIAFNLSAMGNVHKSMGELINARGCYEESLEIATTIEDKSQISSERYHLGLLAKDEGHLDEAKHHLLASLNGAYSLDEAFVVHGCIINLALLETSFEKQVQWLGKTIAESKGYVDNLAEAKERIEALKSELGEEIIKSLLEAGEALDIDDIVQELLADYES